MATLHRCYLWAETVEPIPIRSGSNASYFLNRSYSFPVFISQLIIPFFKELHFVNYDKIPISEERKTLAQDASLRSS